LARLIDSEHRHETTFGPADDALDADGERILDYAQAQNEGEELARLALCRRQGWTLHHQPLSR